jgi:hypothetical protein
MDRCLLRIRAGRPRRRAKWMLKSCDRLFDIPCKDCDRKISDRARAEWVDFMSTPRSDVVERPTEWALNPIEVLKASVRELVGASWASKRQEAVDRYCPDQQGCLENERLSGGTLGVSEEEESSDPSLVRIGVAKTKGKFRVVTMQSSRVKRILAPIHNALYDHISSYGWCVRGDVTKGDFASITADRRAGEVYVSADYSAATNNLDPVAVRAVVDVLCESEHLTDEERTTLRGSFDNIRWLSRSGREYAILKGSMMGNLVSFPVLCLLNKACYDIARYSYPESRRTKEVGRKCRVNGDDIMFAGTERFFLHWKSVVGHYGFVVNESKTGLSRRFVELNSRSYDSVSKTILPKACLGFFRRDDSDRDLLGEVCQRSEGLSKRTVSVIINDWLRFEICQREVKLSTIPPHVFSSLVKKRWFRNWVRMPPPALVSKGMKRSVPMIVDVPPQPRVYQFVLDRSRELQAELLSEVRGKKCAPEETTIDRGSCRDRFARILRKWVADPFCVRASPEWRFVWPQELFTFFRDSFPSLLLDKREVKRKWIEDHPFLTTCVSLVKTRASSRFSEKFAPPPELMHAVNVHGFIRFPNGHE